MNATDITIVGAGPYGLSIAAYLNGYGINYRIIGKPMQSWQTQMPKGMELKSAGLSSSLFDPEGQFTLPKYCADKGIPYADEGIPVTLETFTQYGLAFQKRFAPHLEEAHVTGLTRTSEGFEIRLDNGNTYFSRKVVVGVGLDYFRHIPEQLREIPQQYCTHSGQHYSLDKFRGKKVVVIGGGSSAIDMAVLLNEVGAKVQLVTRRPSVEFGAKEGNRTLWEKIRAPMSGVGPGWKNRMCTDLPGLFRFLPDTMRLRIVKEFLGPFGGWFVRERFKSIEAYYSHHLGSAKVKEDKIELRFFSVEGELDLIADHVIAATGYQTDIDRIGFIDKNLVSEISLIGKTPRLNGHFESSVPGLYFVGPATATSFGPVMRFAVGAGYTARKVSRHLARFYKHQPRSHSSSKPALAGGQFKVNDEPIMPKATQGD